MQIQCNHISKNYHSFQALKDINFHVDSGAFFAMIGANGAGKSTLLDILTKRIPASQGTVLINNQDISKTDANYFRDIGIVFQDHVLDDELSIETNMMIRAQMHYKKAQAKERVFEMLDFIGMREIAKRRYKQLSGGQKRKIDIAVTLLHYPKILFLDEPTTGVDVQSRQDIWKMIAQIRSEHQVTIFLTTHYLEEAEIAEQMILLNRGEIVAQGTPTELKQQFAKDTLLLVPKHPKALASMLQSYAIPYTIDRGNYIIPLKHAKESIQIIKQANAFIETFEVKLGTLDDVFVHFIGEKGAESL
ncbi:ABC transporter ATP-binding protein [Listeria booriae]|uniref:ABC transporter ATP-binding protein n=1 Tax=Listeria booriae TaxID=1552123 RepID=UPI001628B4AA|nr:ABC transporter ATP-binding protein [Listeria booriae]MBC1291667.1 ABC transporter ATP-binding protein [Listeria booriae]MBC1944577.1 ABC transporter ATP-binding protein [Listeria booriae]MBC6163616.1 ABC transporter ATP-binding protein [Listeria booriae]MBC6166218.1 ABC transporter ATP-binding protein [Listeria booriae]